MVDEFMSLTDFETAITQLAEKELIDSIPASTKSKTWQEMERGKQEGHHDDTQQHYFHSD